MAPELVPGEEVGSYRIEAPIGRGGMGVVYRALDIRLGRQVALKVLARDRAEDEVFRDRFLRESRILASLDDPHIVPIFEAGEDSGHLFIAMRLVLGPDLRTVLETQGRLRPARAVEVIGQIAGALDTAHVRGLIHRDVKPANILLAPASGAGQEDHIYLSDFGLTKQSGSESGLTAIGQFVGTPGFVAPEQIEGKTLDHRVDVYALGCVLYSCLTGEQAYPRDSTIASLWAHLQEPPPRATPLVPELPRAFDDVIERAMARNPEDRYQTAGGLAAAARVALSDAKAPARRGAAATVAAATTVALASTGAPDDVEPDGLLGQHPATAAREDETVVGVTPLTVLTPVAGAMPAVGSATPLVGSDDPDAPTTPVTGWAVAPASGRRGNPPRRRTAAIAAGGLVGLLGATGLAFAFVSAPGAGPTPSPSTASVGEAMASAEMSHPPEHEGATHGPGPVGPADPEPQEATPTPTAKAASKPPTSEPVVKPETPKPDTQAPTGAIKIDGGDKFTNDRTVRLSLSGKDNTKVTRMRISNGTSRGTAKEYTYARSKNWKVTSGAGHKTISVWYYDGRSWSKRYKDTIIYDRAPQALSGFTFHRNSSSDCASIASYGYVRLPVLPYLGKDADGVGTLRVTKASDRNTGVPWVVESGKKIVRVGITPASNFSEVVFTGRFELADTYNLKSQGTFSLHVGPCP